MKRQQLWEQLEDVSIRLREASLAAAAASGLQEVNASHALWVQADAEFREVVDKLRALRARRKRKGDE